MKRRSVLLAMLLFVTFLGHASAAAGDGLFTDRFLVTEDGVPVKRLAVEQEITGLAYDEEDEVLYLVVQDFFGVNGGYSISSEGVTTDYSLCPMLPDGETGVGLTFDSSRRSLFLLTRDVLRELDSSMCIVGSAELPFHTGDFASLAYDSSLDAFWAWPSNRSSITTITLVSRSGTILDELDVAPSLEANECIVSLAFDADAESLWIVVSCSSDLDGPAMHLLNVARDGTTLEKNPLPGRPFGGLAWTSDCVESHIAARSGFLFDSFVPNVSLYAPPSTVLVNGSFGDDHRVVTVPVGESLTIDINHPPSAVEMDRFALFVFPGEAGQSDLSYFTRFPVFSREFGVPVFPLPLTDGDSSMTRLVVNATGRPALGEGLFDTGPAPASIAIPGGVASPMTVTLQAFAVIGLGSLGGRLTNAVVLNIE